jgi:AbiJ-like protein
MSFSQRIGKTTSAKLVQHESIDDDLQNSLWSALTIIYFDKVRFERSRHGRSKHCSLTNFLNALWTDHLKEPTDLIPYTFSDAVSFLRKHFFSIEWYRQLDFVEDCSNSGPTEVKNDFVILCNSYLKRENSAYRFVNGELSEITSEIEIEEVERATNASGIYAGVQEHLKSALSLMNDRTNPDYRNSIKESISAVESLSKILSGNEKATLGQALKVIEKNGSLHKALKSAFSSLYGYTNDADGIRHALLDESTLKKADARFMIVSCSAFVNYLMTLSSVRP